MNINIVPIDYASQPRLRGRLTLRRLALRRKPWTFSGLSAGESLTLLFATHVSILTSDTSSMLHNTPSQAYRTLRYQ